MFKIDVEELEWAGKPLRIETGRMARQADGAVLVSYGETTVLATAVAAREAGKLLHVFQIMELRSLLGIVLFVPMIAAAGIFKMKSPQQKQ